MSVPVKNPMVKINVSITCVIPQSIAVYRAVESLAWVEIDDATVYNHLKSVTYNAPLDGG